MTGPRPVRPPAARPWPGRHPSAAWAVGRASAASGPFSRRSTIVAWISAVLSEWPDHGQHIGPRVSDHVRTGLIPPTDQRHALTVVVTAHAHAVSLRDPRCPSPRRGRIGEQAPEMNQGPKSSLSPATTGALGITCRPPCWPRIPKLRRGAKSSRTGRGARLGSTPTSERPVAATRRSSGRYATDRSVVDHAQHLQGRVGARPLWQEKNVQVTDVPAPVAAMDRLTHEGLTTGQVTLPGRVGARRGVVPPAAHADRRAEHPDLLRAALVPDLDPHDLAGPRPPGPGGPGDCAPSTRTWTGHVSRYCSKPPPPPSTWPGWSHITPARHSRRRRCSEPHHAPVYDGDPPDLGKQFHRLLQEMVDLARTDDPRPGSCSTSAPSPNGCAPTSNVPDAP